MKTGSAALAAVLALSAFVVVDQPQASAATIDPTAWYVLVDRNSGKALDVSGSATNDGARIIQWSRNDGVNQQWQFVDAGGGYYRVKSRSSGKVLDVSGASTADNTAIVQWTDAGGANQQFRPVDAPDGNVKLIARHSAKAVDVRGASKADNVDVVQNTDTGSVSQQWQLVNVGSGDPDPGPGPGPGDGCGKTPTLRNGTYTIQSGGKSRSFIIRIPSNYNNTTKYRLIFGLHWRGGTANDVASGGSSGAAWAFYGQQEQSNNSAILVAPQGLGNGWGNSGGEDVTFVDDMIKRIEGDLCVNPAQRFATGFSWGGGMSYALACARPNVFRAVAAISGGEISGCSGGSGAVAYFGIHGVSDNVLGIGQGRSLRDRFVRNNGCAAQNPREPAPGSRTHITTTYSCRAGFPVQWAAFDGGHAPAPVEGCGCDDGARTWTKAEIWRFFAQFQ